MHSTSFHIGANSNLRKFFRVLDGINVFFISVFLPMQLGFLIPMEGSILTFEIISWILSLIQIVVTFLTPVEYEGQMTTNKKEVLKAYWNNNGLFYDLCGALPFNWIFGKVFLTNHHAFTHFLRLLRIMSVGKILMFFE
jgi:hypothetical protein